MKRRPGRLGAVSVSRRVVGIRREPIDAGQNVVPVGDGVRMHSIEIRNKARAMYESGRDVSSIASELALPRATVRDWCGYRSFVTDDLERGWGAPCVRCADPPGPPTDQERYGYLLGLYLGDGHITLMAKSVYRLRIFCTAAYPDLLAECAQAMAAVMPTKVSSITKGGCTTLYSHSKHWPCLLPQHGPGMKHLRQIALEPWQKDIVRAHPRPFLRGLIHSDGCRVVNHTTRNGKRYEYVRYLFSNESVHILGLCGWALDLIGAEWRHNRRNSISVAKRDSVALLETFIGPKSLRPAACPGATSPYVRELFTCRCICRR